MAATKRKEPGERIVAPRAESNASAGFPFDATDALLLALILAFAMLLIARSGFVNGQELWPMPDAVEYSAIAANLDRGLGPVLHFAGLTYPTRYTIGYPLMLAVAYPLLGHHPERLCWVTALTALVALAGIYTFALWIFDRRCAVLAALLLATSPQFLGLSTCVLSDVPSLAVALLAMLAFLYAMEKGSPIVSALCGLLVGWAVTIRLTNGTILIAMLAAVWLVQPRRLKVAQAAAFALGLIPLPVVQAWANYHYLGSPLSNGYTFWRPDLYSKGLAAFAPSYLLYPALTQNKHGNLFSYALAMLGIDGQFGQLNIGFGLRTLRYAHYSLYPFPVAIFAGLGALVALRGRDTRIRRGLYAGFGFLAGLILVYLFYFSCDTRFLLPGLFPLFSIAAYGMVTANRNLKAGWSTYGVIALDAMVAAAFAIETVSVLMMPAPDSKIVAEVYALKPRLSGSVVVTDVSLQWLDLFAGAQSIEFVGLDSLFAEEALNEYHLHFLYENKAAGHSWPMPPILLPDGRLDPVEARRLADEDRAGRPVYLLVAMPLRQDWASTLMGEFGELDGHFSLETIVRYPEIGLYHLRPR